MSLIQCFDGFVAASAGASSGLHHDFHDNLYVLLRGCKRFRLWSPRQAERMHTHGRISRVHPNGRIVYEGEVCSIGCACKDCKTRVWQNYPDILLVSFDDLLMEPCDQGEVLADGSRVEELETKRSHGIRTKRETAANSDAESVELEAALDRAIEQCDMESSRSAYFVVGA